MNLSRQGNRPISAQSATLRPIVIVALPKSGSTFLRHTLARTYNLPPAPLHFGGTFPAIEINRALVAELKQAGPFLMQSHASASRNNIATFDHFFGRAILHVRDPRQMLLSWVHWTEVMRGDAMSRAIFGLDESYYV